MTLSIGRRQVGPDAPLFVIAELGINHNGSPDAAVALAEAAARAGASAVKLQTIVADRLVARACPAPAHVQAASLRDFFRQFELDAPAHRRVAECAHANGMAMMSTPFSEEAVAMLVDIGCDALKIASGDITHRRLIETAARSGLPLVMSTGMSSLEEVCAAVDWAHDAGARGLALLHCVSAYPVPLGSENLAAIAELGHAFDMPIGLSDHGVEPLSAALAVALGATLYERHFVLDRSAAGADAAVSADPVAIARLIDEAERARRALGSGRKVCLVAEAPNLEASRRALYATRNLRAGDVVEADAVEALRPAIGLAASRIHELIGSRLERNVEAGTAFLELDLEVHHEAGTDADVA
jgi:N,N'-diacetyllegionaminate synthase